MPGPKRPPVDPDGAVVAEMDASGQDLTLPSTDGYVTVTQRRTRLPDGSMHLEEEKSWTERGLRRWLAVCPKVPVLVPLVGDEGQDPKRPAILPVYYDGWRTDIPKGRTVMVALPIAEIVLQVIEKRLPHQARGIDIYRLADASDLGHEVGSISR